MTEEHLYIVTYDIADERRWRAIFKLMHGYGERMQLSVFQCRLSRQRALELEHGLRTAMSATDDQVMIIDIGPAEQVKPRVQCLGKRGYAPIQRIPVIV